MADTTIDGLWKWIAAIAIAFVIGLTPFLLSQQAQRNYVQKEDLGDLAAQFTALSERVARNEEQIAQATDQIGALVELAQSGEERLSNIEAVLARIEATISANSPTP